MNQSGRRPVTRPNRPGQIWNHSNWTFGSQSRHDSFWDEFKTSKILKINQNLEIFFWKNLNLGLIQLSCGTRSGPHCKMYSKLICFRPCLSVRLTGQKHVENVEGESNIFNMLQRQQGNIICHICLQSYTLLPSFYLCRNTHWQFHKYQISLHFTTLLMGFLAS